MHTVRGIYEGEEFDLDDPTTYDYLPKDLEGLSRSMWYEIGFALWYMDYHMPDFYTKDYPQRIRVESLIRKFTDGRLENCQNVLWWQEQIFLFQDEIENMC